MNAIEQAISDAETSGYIVPRVNDDYGSIDDSAMFLDPLFWQALGRANGWIEHTNSTTHSKILGTYGPEWRLEWHRFIDALAEGKDANSFFEEIYKT